MSYITDVIVHVDYATEEMHKAITTEFNAGLYRSGAPRVERLTKISIREAGGGKVFTGEVYAGSYNHLDCDGFLAWFETLGWNEFSHVVISIASEGFYHLYRWDRCKLLEVSSWD